MMDRMEEYRSAIETFLKTVFDRLDGTEGSLRKAMEYSLLAGGKRIRPQLLLEFYRQGSEDWHKALSFACALEMIHTYSLIHDDLPCMDDDDLRRGKPTCHRVYGEWMALLAGDGLLNGAYELMLSAEGLPIQAKVKAASAIAAAAGGRGMIGGQVLDMTQGELTREAISQIQEKKTGALICAAAEAGVLLAEEDSLLSAARMYAQRLGLAFQIRDDLLDLEGSVEELGKNVGVDQDKRTFPALLGVDESRRLLHCLTQEAIDALAPLKEKAFLETLAKDLEMRRS